MAGSNKMLNRILKDFISINFDVSEAKIKKILISQVLNKVLYCKRDKLRFGCIIRLNENNIKEKIKIYPNPANDIIEINLTDNVVKSDLIIFHANF